MQPGTGQEDLYEKLTCHLQAEGRSGVSQEWQQVKRVKTLKFSVFWKVSLFAA